MTGSGLFHLSVTFAIVTGSAAGILSLLSWEVFRHSTFGRVVFAFSILMSVFILYHVLLMVVPEPRLFLSLVESLFYTALAAFVVYMVHVEYQLGGDRTAGGVMHRWR